MLDLSVPYVGGPCNVPRFRARGKIIHQLDDRPLTLASNAIGSMLESFIGKKSGVRPAYHNWDAALAQAVRQLVAAGSGGRGN